MGNKTNKAKILPKSYSTRNLNDLPVEIIYKILDELDLPTVFTSLYHVCKHLDQVLLTYNQYHVNLKKLSFKNLQLISTRLRPEQITALTLSDDESCLGLLEFFLSKYPIDKCQRLRSVTLTQINNEELVNQILIPLVDRRSLPNLTSVKIIDTEESYGEIFLDIITSLLSKPSIRDVYFDLSYFRTTSNPLQWEDESSIKRLTFVGSCSVNFLRTTFTYVPQLETLKIDDLDFDEEINMNLNVLIPNHDDTLESIEDQNVEFDEQLNANENPLPREERYAEIHSPNQLKSLIINGSTINMAKLEWFLKEMPNLKHFRLLTATMYDDESILDGQRWENLVFTLDKFEFVFVVGLSQDSTWSIDQCLDQYRSPFWIEDKKWFVSIEKYDQDVILYSLPYRNYFFLTKTDSVEFEYRSNDEHHSNLQSQSMDLVNDLYIDVSAMKKSQFDCLPNIGSPRFTCVTKLSLYGKWPKAKTFFDDLKTIVDLNQIEELIRDECIPTADFVQLLELTPNLRSIKTSTNFLDALNAARFSHKKLLRSLTIDTNNYTEQRYVNIEPFCDMFPRIEYLNIPLENVSSCQYLLDHASQHQDLISVTFRVPLTDISYSENDTDSDDENNNDAFSEWIKTLPKSYRCIKRQQLIQIWCK